MSTSCEWIIEQMESYPEKYGISNVVFSVHWRCNANNGNYNSTAYGSVGVESEKSENFISYDNLTKEEVIKWVKSALGEDEVTQIETGLIKNIENMISPPILKLPNPWDK